MSEHNVVQLSLDKEDHFFQNIERSRLAAGLIVRRRCASQVSIANQAWVGNDAISTRVVDATDASQVSIRLHPHLLGACFSEWFALSWFQPLLTLMVLGLSAALIVGEPSTPLSVAVFAFFYCVATVCIASRLEYSLLLGEVTSRFQAVFMLLWGVVLAVSSGYQAGFEYNTVGVAAGLSQSEYISQVACSMCFNATAFVVLILLDAMPTLAPLTKAGALLLFIGSVLRLWITDRLVMKNLLQPQMMCVTSEMFSESCIDTQRLKAAALSSVCIFLMHSLYISLYNAWYLAPGQNPVFVVIRSQMTVELLEPDEVVPIEVDLTPEVVLTPPAPGSTSIPQEPPLPGSIIVPLVEITGTTVLISPANISATRNDVTLPQIALSQSEIEGSPSADVIDLRTDFLLDFPLPQRYLDPLLGHRLYDLWLLRSMKVFYAVLGVLCLFLFMSGQPNSSMMVPVVALLMFVLFLGGLMTYDRAMLRDLRVQFEYRFFLGSIVVYVALTHFYFDMAKYAVYSGKTEFVAWSAEIIFTAVWLIGSWCLVSFDASFAPLAIKRWMLILWLINNCYVLYNNVFVFPLQTVLLAGDTVPLPWLESSRWCLAGECISAQSVRIQVLTTVIFFTGKYTATLMFRPRSMIILKAGISFECTNDQAVVNN